jgi:lipooligosaccharide transport system permease protein
MSIVDSRAARSFSFWFLHYKRTWRGTIVSSLISPALFLGAMGFGLGSLVDKHQHVAGAASRLGGVSYASFLAPGLLAAAAMQLAVQESTWPVLASVKWRRTYYAMLATPLDIMDVLFGHLAWIATRLVISAVLFFGVMLAFGAVHSSLAVLAIPAAVLTGLAFAAPIVGFSVTRESDQGFAALFRFGVMPLFLFSGTFFPVTQLPAFIRPVAYFTPLWHGVQLSRGLALGGTSAAGASAHVAYLLVWVAVGVAIARRAYRTKLHT